MITKSTGDQAMIKKINTAIVLEAVLKDAPLSRAQISERTGLNKATVSSLVQQLIDRHLVIEIGHGESSGGRKPVMLLFNAQAGHAVGIDLGVNYIRGVLTDLDGAVLHERVSGLQRRDPDHVLPELASCIEYLIARAPDSPYGIVGIGIGVPGIVDDRGTVLLAPNLEWRNVPLREWAEERFALPVAIDNEANAGALGEQKYGAGRNVAHQIYVSVGIGIGTGIILNKELYKGASGFSGELGHLSIELDGKPCRCGSRGCWELYASEMALLERAAPLGYEDLDALLDAAEQDGRVRQLFRETGTFLGAGIASIANVFNPDLVIIGNRMSKAQRWIEEAVREEAAKRALPYHRERMRIQFAELEDRSAVRGAANDAISRFFAKVKSGRYDDSANL